ncbi:NirD/YgiW/YdeI family stress tolerance protein [Allochromatium palmeri]|uniref:NirD/YgiW/YdeI family stress tolerance protein n=2 Tax=Allochromatium palmeri TaxID=231048 RepID=A0A6N8EEW0_9GAMM|nr:NirD/YgiW/YdeI family stress tolerance protein [Allochromatium palmeri]
MRCNPLMLTLAGTLFALPAVAEQDPYMQPDETWISLGGVVESVERDHFTLNYGDGNVIVEMDDGDRDADAYKLLPGDKVNVVGKVDDDLFETTTIEAGSVYLEKLGTTFFSSAADEEDTAIITTTVPIVIAQTWVSGQVTSIGDDEFTVDTGKRKLTVSTDQLGFDPLDDEGYLKVRKGDRVNVTGTVDDQFFGGPELLARSLIVMRYSTDKAPSEKAEKMSGSEKADKMSGQSL